MEASKLLNIDATIINLSIIWREWSHSHVLIRVAAARMDLPVSGFNKESVTVSHREWRWILIYCANAGQIQPSLTTKARRRGCLRRRPVWLIWVVTSIFVDIARDKAWHGNWTSSNTILTNQLPDLCRMACRRQCLPERIGRRVRFTWPVSYEKQLCTKNVLGCTTMGPKSN